MMRSIVLLFILVASQVVFSQIDTKFWFAVPYVSEQHANKPVYLHLSALDKDANVTITVPANADFVPIELVVSPEVSQKVDLTPFLDQLENKEPALVQQKGLLIESDNKITAYYEVLGTTDIGIVNTDIFTLKGENGLGKEFLLFHQEVYRTITSADVDNTTYDDLWLSVDIVATENNTVIKIFDPENNPLAIAGHEEVSEVSITLNKGETYSIRSLKGNAYLPIAKVEANKNIALTYKDDSVLKGGNSNKSWDLLGDQMLPTRVWGQAYLLSGDVFIVSALDSLNLVFTDTDGDTLTSGVTIENPFATTRSNAFQVRFDEEVNVVLQTNRPAQVMSIGGIGNETGAVVLPPLECTGSRKLTLKAPEEVNNVTTVYIPAEGNEDFTINGESISLTEYAALNDGAITEIQVLGEPWLIAEIDFSSGSGDYIQSIENTSTRFHLSVENGSSITGAQYGYFSSFSSFSFPSELIEACIGDTVVLESDRYKDAYNWNTGDTTYSILVTQNGKYKVVVTEGEECAESDSIDIVFFEPPAPQVFDTLYQFCVGDSLELVADTSVYESIVWSDSSNNAINYFAESLDTAWVLVSNGPCVAGDTFAVQAVPFEPLAFPKDTFICEGERVLFALPSGYSSYVWNNEPSDDTAFVFTGEGTLKIKIESIADGKVCGADSADVNISHWNIQAYNTITPNDDQINDKFTISGIETYPFQLEVYNRWGELIYMSYNYDNQWYPEDLNQGTYYYSISGPSECTERKGWLYVTK